MTSWTRVLARVQAEKSPGKFCSTRPLISRNEHWPAPFHGVQYGEMTPSAKSSRRASARQGPGTDGEGAFRLGPLPRGREEVELRLAPGPGCRALREDPHLPRVEPKARPGPGQRWTLPRAGTLRVRIETGGRPLRRATLHVDGTAGVGVRRRLEGTAAEIPDLPLGAYVVELAAPGWLGTGGRVVAVAAGPGEPSANWSITNACAAS